MLVPRPEDASISRDALLDALRSGDERMEEEELTTCLDSILGKGPEGGIWESQGRGRGASGEDDDDRVSQYNLGITDGLCEKSFGVFFFIENHGNCDVSVHSDIVYNFTFTLKESDIIMLIPLHLCLAY